MEYRSERKFFEETLNTVRSDLNYTRENNKKIELENSELKKDNNRLKQNNEELVKYMDYKIKQGIELETGLLKNIVKNWRSKSPKDLRETADNYEKYGVTNGFDYNKALDEEDRRRQQRQRDRGGHGWGD